MKESDDKYGKVIKLLQQSEPLLSQATEIEEKVLSGIFREKRNPSGLSLLADILFGWTSVNWVRRSLVGAAMVLVFVFIMQQSLILREINQLNSRVEAVGSSSSLLTGSELSRKILYLRLSEKKMPFGSKSISDQRIEELLKSIDRLGKDYRELQDVIENDPELKRLIGKKLSEINSSKIKL